MASDGSKGVGEEKHFTKRILVRTDIRVDFKD